MSSVRILARLRSGCRREASLREILDGWYEIPFSPLKWEEPQCNCMLASKHQMCLSNMLFCSTSAASRPSLFILPLNAENMCSCILPGPSVNLLSSFKK